MEQVNIRYEDSEIDSRIIRAVEEMGFEYMTPIQEQAIPVLLKGRDVIGQAQTGTGKTAAFGIPVLQSIDPENKNLQAVILCPTRELAIQASEEMRRFSKYMHGIKILPVYGGQEIYKQIKNLKCGVQIVVGTPGRVMDHMRRKTLKMQDVKLVVLDEADEMLNMGFREDMETILKEIPDDRQTALFSATMPQSILDITHTYQKDAVQVKVAAKELTVPLIKQYYYPIKKEYKEEAVSRLLECYNVKRSLIFCNTKRMVDELSKSLKNRGYQAEGLHGDLTQGQRDMVMSRFRSGNLEILIATDVAARGIDVDDVEAVFNYDVPQDIEYYVHRIGRTGRAGREGKAFTLVAGREIYKIREIERICKTKMEEKKVPSAKAAIAKRADKILSNALEGAWNEQEAETMKKMEIFIEKKLEECQISPQLLAAALLKMNMGEDIYGVTEEISVERPAKKARKFNAGKPEKGSRKIGKFKDNQKGRDASAKEGKKREKETAKWLKKDKKAIAKEWLKKEKNGKKQVKKKK
ncbi:MAG: DEAD/DEAH box helicase [Lachnospiraceae bacterium]|nr:DEAD/DEAH box helicase [Lachnospiraceae bacterium]